LIIRLSEGCNDLKKIVVSHKTTVMNHRHSSALLLAITITLVFSSCKKDSTRPEAIFYGKWKTSYGDTITFEHKDGKNIVYDFPDYSATSVGGIQTKVRRFAYANGKLQLNDLPDINNQFRSLNSFEWVQPGTVFTVITIDWFVFMSALYKFTFTKIQ
jgi:hypothetical protein